MPTVIPVESIVLSGCAAISRGTSGIAQYTDAVKDDEQMLIGPHSFERFKYAPALHMLNWQALVALVALVALDLRTE